MKIEVIENATINDVLKIAKEIERKSVCMLTYLEFFNITLIEITDMPFRTICKILKDVDKKPSIIIIKKEDQDEFNERS